MASIPNDMLIQISSWLPAKAIHKFKSTDKFFSNFPNDKEFALQQTQNSLIKGETSFFIQKDLSQRDNGNVVELHHLSGEDNSSGVSKDVLEYLAKSTKILFSANGLILCRETTSNSEVKLFLCNPATQTWLPIPLPKKLQCTSVEANLNVILEYDDKNNCKVCIFYDSTEYDSAEFWSPFWDCIVYIPKEGIWKEKKKSFFTGSRSLKFDMPVFYKGNIHFISDSFPYIINNSFYFRPYIMAYNFDKGETTMLKVPEEAQVGSHDVSCNMGIFLWGKNKNSTESICLVRMSNCVFTIWITINYEEHLWKRIFEISVEEMGVAEKDPIVTNFRVLNGALLIFATRKKIYSYGLNLSYPNYMKIGEICEHGCGDRVSLTSYSNTLCRCGNDDARSLLLHSTSFEEEETFEA